MIVYATDRDVDAATQRVQAALDEIDEWADAWDMTARKSKTKSILFSSHQNEVNSKRPLYLCMGNDILEQVKETKILGVTFDSQLRFRAHIDHTKRKVEKRLNAMKALAGTNWGCRGQTLRTLYKTFIQPIALYGSSTFVQFASQSNREMLDRSAKAAARIITGCPVDTRQAVLMAEANIRPITSIAEEQGAILFERIQRLPTNIPAVTTAQRHGEPRLQHRDAWRPQAQQTTIEAGLAPLPREGSRCTTQAPWDTQGTGTITINTVAADKTRKTDRPDARRSEYEKVAETLPPASAVYFTDGSSTAGSGKGGAGIVRKERGGRGDKNWNLPAGDLTSSYRTEQVALLEAMKDATNAPEEITTIRICTDSLALLERIKKGPWRRQPETMVQIWESIGKLRSGGKHLQLLWVPGHAGVRENEEADAAANEGRNQTQRPNQTMQIDFQSAKAAIKRSCQKKWSGIYNTTVPLDHPHRRATGGMPIKDEVRWSRREQVALHQLRANRCPQLQATLFRWKRPGTDGTCDVCGDPEDTEHFICECPKYQGARTGLLGPSPEIDILQTEPDAVIRFIRRTGLLKA